MLILKQNGEQIVIALHIQELKALILINVHNLRQRASDK